MIVSDTASHLLQGSFKIRGIGHKCTIAARTGARKFISSSGGTCLFSATLQNMLIRDRQRRICRCVRISAPSSPLPSARAYCYCQTERAIMFAVMQAGGSVSRQSYLCLKQLPNTCTFQFLTLCSLLPSLAFFFLLLIVHTDRD